MSNGDERQTTRASKHDRVTAGASRASCGDELPRWSSVLAQGVVMVGNDGCGGGGGGGTVECSVVNGIWWRL